MSRRTAFCMVSLGLALSAPRLRGVVISEIHFAPPSGDEALEFVELTNDTLTPEDISGYSFTEGITFEIPGGTVLGGHGVVVVCANAQAVKAKYAITNAVGDFAGKLDNSGERITLTNQAGVVVQSIRYRARGKWPVAPLETGHTLVLRSLLDDSGEPESWVQSTDLGGSPGRLNFGADSSPPSDERSIVAAGDLWRYAKGNAPFSAPIEAWIAPGFNDSSWLEGPSGFGFGDGDDATVLADMQNGYTSVACRKSFTLTAAEVATGSFFLGVDFDDGFCAYLNGVQIAATNCSPAGAAPVSTETATASREAGSETLYPIQKSALVAGRNVLAIAGYNLSVGSTDFSLIPQVIVRGVAGGGPTAEEPIVSRGESWRYMKGTGPFSNPPSAWRSSSFDDGAWLTGASGFGYRVVGGETTAYLVPAGTVGNQDYGGSLGMDFDISEPIVLTRLGVFDSGSDGLNLSITARLYDRSSQSELASLEFTPESQGELREGSRFKDLASPLDLPAGFSGTIVAEGYGSGESNGNQGTAPLGLQTDTGTGAIVFVGGGRYGNAGAYPSNVDGGPENRYAAGTFDFRRPGGPAGQIVAPQGAATLLADMQGAYTSVATRRRFDLTRDDLDKPGDYFLGIEFDDGFCAYLNGVEVARVNCGAPGSEPVWNALASGTATGGGERAYPVPAGSLVEGENVLAIVGFNDDPGGSSFLLTARLFRRASIPSLPGGGALVLNELFRGAAPGQGWVELYNAGDAPIDLSGNKLTDDPARPNPFVFAEGSTIEARGFLTVSEAQSGLVLSSEIVHLFVLAPDGRAIAASTFDQKPATGTPAGAWSECRVPDGGDLEWISRTPTQGSPNQAARIDSIVINEVFYNPPENRKGEFIELYNRGAAAVDLSGFRFTDGIDFTFEPGARLQAGQYLVVAEDPALIQSVYGVTAFGPYSGKLSDKGESIRLADRDGNPVDEVRYSDGGRWSEWADGGGSSLERIDPMQNGVFASAWDASDESAKADWEELAFDVPAYVPASESELHIYLAERGECLLDDVSIRRGAGANLIPNPGFEAGTQGWLIDGTLVRSARTTEDRHSGAACLKVVASGKGDTLVNRIEIETSPAMTAGQYSVALWARWLRGSDLMIVHGEYSSGPFRVTPCFTCGSPEPNLSGNPMSAPLRLSIPLDLGTPGAENSARRKLRESTGGANLGPVIGGARHEPAVPEPGLTVKVTARIVDSDGVASAVVRYRVGSAQGPFDAAELEDDGLHGDGFAGDGLYGGELPGFTSGSRVVYYIEATDSRGAKRAFPVSAPGQTLLFLVLAKSSAGKLDGFHIVLDTQRTTELQTRKLHSNDLVDASFVFAEERAFQNVGMRYRGSPWGRPSLLSYSVRFNEDDKFLRGLGGINVSKTGTAINEGSAMFLIGRNGYVGHPSPSPDYLYGRGWLNGGSIGMKGLIEPIDGDFLEKWQGDGAVGPLLKAYGRFVFNDGGGLVGQAGWEGASFIYRGAESENYRGYFGHAMGRSEDDWVPLFDLTRTLDAVETPNAVFDAEIGNIVDLDAFFRVFGARMLITDCDGFGINNGHNGHIAFNSITGRWGYLPFDVECSYVTSAPNLLASADPAITRLLTRPPSRRAYFRVLSEFLAGYWSPKANPLLDAMQTATGLPVGGVKGQIAAVANLVRTTIQSAQGVPFRIVTNSGNDFSVATIDAELEGDASVDVESLLVSLNGAEAQTFSPLWSTTSRWKTRFLLAGERTTIEVLGFDGRGGLVGSDTITVTTTFQPQVSVSSILPATGPATGGTRVTIRGSGFAQGVRALFGGSEGSELVIKSPQELEVTTPPAPAPFPPGGQVDVSVVLAATRVDVSGAFTYVAGSLFLRGDANSDGDQDISDAVRILAYLFLGTAEPLDCQRTADLDDSGSVNISDPILLLNYLFLSGSKPSEPFDACGPDPTPDQLDCASPGEC